MNLFHVSFSLLRRESGQFSYMEPLAHPELTPYTPPPTKKSNMFYARLSLSEGLKTKLSFFEGTFQNKKI